jgi:FkbM family methyltransferase
VIAFEPFTDTFNILDGNIMKNGLNNVRCMDVGLSNEYKNLLMKSIDGNAGMNRIDDKGIMPILVVPFDEIGVGGSITLIKLDCEGYEEKALLGMIKTINEHQPALFIECQTEKELVAISKILIPLGYSNKRKFNATPTYYFDVR